MDTWLFRKNKPNSKPIKPKTNPIQTQFKPIQTQFKPNNQLSIIDNQLKGHPEGCQLPAISIEIGSNSVYYITLKFRNAIYENKWKILSIPKSIQEVSND